jgi:thiamine-phosphate pyrophosphorylase
MASVTARLCLLFTPASCRLDPWLTLARALDGGVDLVQWRVKAAGDPKGAATRDAAARCLATCRARAVAMVVNDDVDLALALAADGAHVGQEDLPAVRARALLGPHRILGVSTHDLPQLAAAEEAGADYVGFGPCFPTPTKGYREGLGATAAGDATRRARIPVFAIGGIDAARAGALAAAGCTRVAVSSSILGALDPERAARALRAALGA